MVVLVDEVAHSIGDYFHLYRPEREKKESRVIYTAAVMDDDGATLKRS